MPIHRRHQLDEDPCVSMQPQGTGKIIAVQDPELRFQIHKIPATAQHDDLYTIGLWQGSVLCGICYVQPIDRALVALRRVLEGAGNPRMEKGGVNANDSVRDASSSHLRHVGAVVWSFFAGLIRVGR